MKGLLIENLAQFIRGQWGEGKWESVRKHAGINIVAFSIHHVYPETLLQRLAKSASQALGVDERQFFEEMGEHFVQYVSQYGYDQILTVLGRHLRDFLNGLDNLHEYLKFAYPRMRAPSFYCDDETETGLKLHYRSKRRGFVYYVMGQIKQVAKQFYNEECGIQIVSEEVVGETMHVVLQLSFDNSAFAKAESIRCLLGKDMRLPVRASTLFELFPFCIVFDPEMEITHTGHTLMTILKDLVGQIMTEVFDMTRPLIPFCFSAIMQRRNNIFELVTVAPIHDASRQCGNGLEDSDEMEGIRLRLRGQMLYMEEWNMMLYIANPVMPHLDSLVEAGLFINDLSLHDCSRDLVLAGTQQSVALKLALDQEQQKSRKLVQSMKKLDEEMKRTDELLYQMIPKQVADRLRKGENPVETCQTFEVASVLFSEVVHFSDICSKITPMQVVSMLNHMYFLFDQLTERNGVYKVETVGDSYMVVSGAPQPDSKHSERICDMAMDMIDASDAIEDPSEEDKALKIRIGCHSGAIVAGVVGLTLPRYCLFGDTVNTASRMKSTGEVGRIQISKACKDLLPKLYTYEMRGTVAVKGKGDMKTYWLTGRTARVPLSKYFSKSIIWTAPKPKIPETINRPPTPPINLSDAEFLNFKGAEARRPGGTKPSLYLSGFDELLGNLGGDGLSCLRTGLNTREIEAYRKRRNESCFSSESGLSLLASHIDEDLMRTITRTIIKPSREIHQKANKARGHISFQDKPHIIKPSPPAPAAIPVPIALAPPPKQNNLDLELAIESAKRQGYTIPEPGKATFCEGEDAHEGEGGKPVQAGTSGSCNSNSQLQLAILQTSTKNLIRFNRMSRAFARILARKHTEQEMSRCSNIAEIESRMCTIS